MAFCQDIKEWDDEHLDELVNDNDIIGVIGGPPCQGFSSVGTRDVNDPRNHLYMEYCRVVEKVQSKIFWY